MQASVFPPGHPYRRPVGGTHESLDALTLTEARRWTSERYRPEVATIVVTGDVAPGDAARLASTSLPPGLCSAPAPRRARPTAPASPPPPPPTSTFARHNLKVGSPELW